MKALQQTERTWRFPRLQLEDQLWLALFVWAGAAVVAMVVVAVVSIFGSIEISAWEIASGIAPWFVGVMSGWVMYMQVPLFVANGRTRRDSYIEWLIVAAIYPVWTAFLTTVGYLIEWVVYDLAGWHVRLGEGHLFDTRTDVGRIFLEYLLTLGVWVAVGGFVGVSLYRSPDAGWLSLLPAAFIVVLSGSMERSEIGFFGIITRLIPAFDATSIVTAFLMSLGGMLIAVAATWRVVRDMPLRNR
jgi:hypothetical protein